MKNTRFVATVSLLALVAGVSVASAQQAPPAGQGYGPAPVLQRSGFIIGFSLGAGSMVPDCDGCDSESGVAADIHLGGMISPRMAIMWNGSGVAHTEGDLTLVNAINVAAIQYWVGPKIWLKGGLGFGQLSLSDGDGNTEESDTAAAFVAAAGYEVMQTRRFVLDASLRLASVTYDTGGDDLNLTNVSLNLGFNWY